MQSRIQKQEAAVKRVLAWQEMTPMAQLAELDQRLGVGVGAKRQRAVLAARIEKMSGRDNAAVTNDPPNGGNPGGGFTGTPYKKKGKK